MGLKEKTLINTILLNLPEHIKLFRINCGMAWTGKFINKIKNKITLENPRPFHGAPNGFPDLAGWESITITPEMVGKKIAVFTGYEVKATGDLSKKQENFKKKLIEDGGNFIKVTNNNNPNTN